MTSLNGIRVVEISTSVAGPYAGQILADLGADVVKIERPGVGDDSRSWGPPFWEGEGTVFLALNRNKRSLAVDFKRDEGREILRRLLRSSDVLVQNLRPGALAAAGFGERELRELNPRLIYCEMTGYGSQGPLADAPAYDPMLQAYSGIVDMTGEEGRPPVRVPVPLLDMGSAMWGAIGVLDALRARETTGTGSHVEVSLLGTAAAWLTIPLLGVLAGSGRPERLGSGMSSAVPHGAYRCADGYLFLSAANQTLWERLCRAIGQPQLIDDERFTDNPTRVAHRAEVTEVLEALLGEWRLDELTSVLRQAQVPCSPVNSVSDVVQDEQLRSTGMLMEVPHSRIADFTVVATPLVRDGRFPEYRSQPPEVGADTRALLAKLGYDDGDCDLLRDRGVVGEPARSTVESR